MISKGTIRIAVSVIGTILMISGFYYLGYHNGLEFMRKSDSGLGGLGELTIAWIQIIVGFALVAIVFLNWKGSR